MTKAESSAPYHHPLSFNRNRLGELLNQVLPPNTSEPTVPLLFVYDESVRKVVYAAARKDFFNILLSIFTLPLGSLTTLCKESEDLEKVKLGCLSNVQFSTEKMHHVHYSNGEETKEVILAPVNCRDDYCKSLSFNVDPNKVEYFICSKFDNHCTSHRVSTFKDAKCGCRGLLDRPIELQPSHNGFLADSDLIYVIDESLRLEPLTVDSCGFNLIKGKLDGRDSFKEWLVYVDQKSMVDLIKCCLSSTTPLSDFLFKTMPPFKQVDAADPTIAKEINYKEWASEDVFDDLNNESIRLKLVVDTVAKEIVYAYADEKFVEILMSFLAYPLGSVIDMLKGKTGLYNIDCLYRSAKLLDAKHLPASMQSLLLKPLVAHNLAANVFMLGSENAPEMKLHKNLRPKSEDTAKWCVSKGEMFTEGDTELVSSSAINLTLVQKYAAKSGCLLKAPNMFLIHNTLNFGPLMGGIPLADFPDDWSILKETIVDIRMMQCFQLLRASLTSGKALHDGLCTSLL